jgi:hypothetical protein
MTFFIEISTIVDIREVFFKNIYIYIYIVDIREKTANYMTLKLGLLSQNGSAKVM